MMKSFEIVAASAIAGCALLRPAVAIACPGKVSASK